VLARINMLAAAASAVGRMPVKRIRFAMDGPPLRAATSERACLRFVRCWRKGLEEWVLIWS
jgi:hypothetical protein